MFGGTSIYQLMKVEAFLVFVGYNIPRMSQPPTILDCIR
jgi:hypothetical protein